MSLKIAINGFGRIGRNIARIIQNRKNIELVAINEINPSNENLSYLFKYDSTLGKYQGKVVCDDKSMRIDGYEVALYHEKDIMNVPWEDHDIDVIIDSSGVSNNIESSRHLTSIGKVRKVIVTHMHPEVDHTIVMGVNENSYDPSNHNVISSSICDANAIAPILHFLDEEYGVESGFVTTLHPWLSYQNLVDAPLHSQSNPGHFWQDFRLARASVGALIPKDTTAISACNKIMPRFEGKLDAISYRTPTHVVSSADMSINISKNVSIEQVRESLESLSKSSNYVDINYEQLVSVDFEQTEASCTIDMQFTRLVQGKMIKIMLWYDNEWGYSNRALDVAELSIKTT